MASRFSIATLAGAVTSDVSILEIECERAAAEGAVGFCDLMILRVFAA